MNISTQSGNIGMVVEGSMSDGIQVKLDPHTSVEQIKVGTFVTVEGKNLRFFGVVTNISLNVTDPSLIISPPEISESYTREVLKGIAAYGSISVEPMLTLSGEDETVLLEGPQPSKTIPDHFSMTKLATENDIQLVFGAEDERHFWIGSPLDMDTKLCLDIHQFVTRSNGVFGKSGTGKTFLTRLLLAGILQTDAAVNLVFDMQSEYGWKGYSEGGAEVKGLKQLFHSKVAVFSLDEESSKRRGLTPDYVVRIGLDEVEPDDIQLLRETLDLSEVAADAAYSLERHFGSSRWLRDFLSLDSKQNIFELAEEIGVNGNALARLKNRLDRLLRFQFIEDTGHGSVEQIMRYLDRGMHVILEFGRYGSNLAAYILVANLLTRRIYDRCVERKERSVDGHETETKPIVITIEEAHKFLMPGIASQTIFGTIARELRKYNVTLLLVDQRPSGIDDEVMSQLGTKMSCLLDSERDVDAVLTGAPGSRKLRNVLSRLESKQQALVFGDSVPMAIVVKTREYGSSESYRSLGFKDSLETKANLDSDVDDLFGP